MTIVQTKELLDKINTAISILYKNFPALADVKSLSPNATSVYICSDDRRKLRMLGFVPDHLHLKYIGN